MPSFAQQFLTGLIAAGVCLGVPHALWAADAKAILAEERAVFAQKSIFSRKRASVRSPVHFRLELVGVVESSGESAIWVEDSSAGSIAVYRVGDLLPSGGGRVVAASLDAVELQTGTASRRVLVGQTILRGYKPELIGTVPANLEE